MNRQSAGTPSTADRILRTFLQLVAERGIDATTTRVLAEAAGVNEVTIFRLFGDKANLATAAVRRFSSAEELAQYPVCIDTSSPANLVDGLVDVLSFLRARMLEHPEMIQFGIAEYFRFPQLKEEIGANPRAARELVERALVAARPGLRADLEVRPASLMLMGLLFVCVTWRERGWLELDEAGWRNAATQAVAGLLRTSRQ
ncbi:MAG: TetR/AcrR family transcriptional regulator [Chloroflexi bacterium]|nr:TetR/AcrR family transcriptional regulator [Chloroflexota bacterium]MBV9133477.1 TetR/AcrR family transcriptional regulator [Chloroflexota bacterium]MBV9898830.1 TetR/AcrR family transcriptional regulator [Chloroflexota bacterium]